MEKAIELRSKLTEDQIDLVKRTVAQGATNDELKMFLYQANKSGLDPLSRQIHFVKRSGRGTIQTGIDGYRLIASRTKECAGIDTPVFTWVKDSIADAHPLSASVTVYRIVQGIRCAFTAEADWDFFYPGEKQGFMWRKGKGKFMLGKCAEALALRKAFPAELSGIYTDEEMHQADSASIPTQKAAPVRPPKGKEVSPNNPKETINDIRTDRTPYPDAIDAKKIPAGELKERWSELYYYFRERELKDICEIYMSFKKPNKDGAKFASLEMIERFKNPGPIQMLRNALQNVIEKEDFESFTSWRDLNKTPLENDDPPLPF